MMPQFVLKRTPRGIPTNLNLASQIAQMTSRQDTLTAIYKERVVSCLPAYSWLMMRILLRPH